MNNFNDMVKKAQEMQKKMQEMQESLSNLEVEGKSGGGKVKIGMNCKNEVKKIDIDPTYHMSGTWPTDLDLDLDIVIQRIY